MIKPTGRPAKPAADRIRESVRVNEDGCWVWRKAKLYGYGMMSMGSRKDGSRRTVRAHRQSYETFVGPIPDGLVIDHLCSNPACVNPAHLEAVTQQVNMIRKYANQAAAKLCPRGIHRWTTATIGMEDGRPFCRPCRGHLA